jgi:hypothetical protein
MAYVAGRSNLKVLGNMYRLGDPVDLTGLPVNKIRSLARLGLLVQDDSVPAMTAKTAVAVADRPVDEGVCPECGEGPFKNLTIHMARKHKEDTDG